MLLVTIASFYFSFAQSFVEKQTRHRFAQNNVGVDFQTSVGGNTFVVNSNGGFDKLDLGSTTRARIIIGGLHFWGHADFYIAIPVMFPRFNSGDQEIFFTSGVETALQILPLAVKEQQNSTLCWPFLVTKLLFTG